MIATSVTIAEELERNQYLLLDQTDFLRNLWKETYAAWREWFSNKSKFSVPGNLKGPSGYFPFTYAKGCEMKESYYYQFGSKLPVSVEYITKQVTAELIRVAGIIADSLETSYGKTLIFEKNGGCLKIMRYPAFSGDQASELMKHMASAGHMRSPVHTDLNALTILPPSTAPGLEIQTGDDQWELMDSKDALLIHAGRELEQRSDGKYKATVHRVRNPLPSEEHFSRLSMAFFVS